MVQSKYLHRTLNIALVVACAFLAASLVQRYAGKRPSGRTISVSGVDFSRSKKTLLLFLQQDCNICIESLPFYRRLIDTFQQPTDVQLVLITPYQPEIADEFFKNAGLSFKTVLQGDRGLLGVKLSPTLILADSSGAVRGSWIGKLQPERENEIWTMLGNDETARGR